MSLRFLESWDHEISGEGDASVKWDLFAPGAGLVGPTAARTGVNGFNLAAGAGNELFDKTLTAQATWIVGTALNIQAAANPLDLRLINTYDGTDVQCWVETNENTPGYTLSLVRDATVVATSGADAIPLDATWYYMELKNTIADAGGLLECRINTSVVVTFTGDTKATVNATADKIRFGFLGSYQHYFDDIYICDGAGAVNNNYLAGSTSPYFRVEALLPGGAGTTTDWTPAAGSNFQNVDEADPDSDTTYNSTATQDAIDTYALGNLAGGNITIAGVQWVGFVRDEAVGNTALKRVIRSGGTNYFGAAFDPGTAYDYALEILETNPDTSAAWTRNGVNGVEAGIQLTAVGGLLIARVSQIVLEVGVAIGAVIAPPPPPPPPPPPLTFKGRWAFDRRRVINWLHHKEYEYDQAVHDPQRHPHSSRYALRDRPGSRRPSLARSRSPQRRLSPSQV